jgi:glutathione peroxidase-family protein
MFDKKETLALMLYLLKNIPKNLWVSTANNCSLHMLFEKNYKKFPKKISNYRLNTTFQILKLPCNGNLSTVNETHNHLWKPFFRESEFSQMGSW